MTNTINMPTDLPVKTSKFGLILKFVYPVLVFLVGGYAHELAEIHGHFLPSDICWTDTHSDAHLSGCVNADVVDVNFFYGH